MVRNDNQVADQGQKDRNAFGRRNRHKHKRARRRSEKKEKRQGEQLNPKGLQEEIQKSPLVQVGQLRKSCRRLDFQQQKCLQTVNC